MRRTIAWMVFCGAAAVVGCARPPAEDPEPAASKDEKTFAEQAEAVRRGESDTIRCDRQTVGDADLEQLDGLEELLRRVNLSHTTISDDGLARIANLHKLIQLRLASDKVSDQGLEHVGKLKELKHLHLMDAPITDQGLEHLGSLQALESLYLDRTGVTDEGVNRLQQTLPGVHLHVDGGHPRTANDAEEAVP